jgi:hypothetical protein
MSDSEVRGEDELFCFVFVCQQGELEAKAMLLAASLRHSLPPGHELVAALPAPASRWGSPSTATLAILRRLSVRMVEIVNRVSPDYPIGNKIDCLAVETSCRRIVFLDSDMLLLRAVDLAPLTAARLAAVPASGAHVTLDEWALFYRACGLPPPSVLTRTLLSGELTPPYFNSGFVSVDAALAPALAEEWSGCATRLLADAGLPRSVRRRFLDQVTLPIAAARLGIDILALPPEWNFPSWGMRIGDGTPPAFFHYQRMARLLEENAPRAMFRSLLESQPDLAEAISSILAATADGGTA